MIAFAHPWFLLGLAGLAVPVVLHLMNREIAVPLRFPSIRFIRVARLPQAGRRRLRDLLLLALRLLLLAAAILALAGPRWRTPGAAGTGNGPVPEVILVVDLSASMQGWHGIENLQRLAAEQLQRWSQSPVGLVTCSRRLGVVLPPSRDHGPVRQALTQLTPEPFRGEPLAGLREALSRFTGAAPRRLVILSDFQQTDWQNPNLRLAAAGADVELVDVNPRREGNSGLVGVRTAWLASGSLRVSATVRNFGSAEVRQNVRLKAGTQVTAREITVPPQENRDVTMVIKPPESVQGELLLDDDAYPGDNHYFFWLGRPAPVTLLAVTALETEPVKKQELFFLQRALETTIETSAIQFRLENVETEFFSLLNLEETPALFLVGGLTKLSAADWQAIRRYLDNGGWVCCLPGDGILNLFQETKKAGILTADFLGLTGVDPRRDMPFGVDWINPEGTLARLAADAAGSDLYLFQILRYMRVRPAADTVSLLKTASGDPLLLEQAVGKGRFFLFTFSFSLGSSDLAMTTAFLPLVRELVSGAVPADYGTMRVECGEAAALHRPDLVGAPERQGSPTARRTLDTSRPGVQVIDGIPVEVNLSRRESVVEKSDLNELRLRLTGQDAVVAGTGVAGAAAETDGRDLRPILGLAMAILFLLEILLAALLESLELRRRNGAAPLPAGN